MASAHVGGDAGARWRHGYVVRQISTARDALRQGSTAGARAALRVLSSDDFAFPQEANQYLRVMRDRMAEDGDVLVAMRRLCRLTPRIPRGTPPGAVAHEAEP